MTAVLAIGSGGSYVDLPTPSYGGYMTTPNEVSKAGTNTSGVLYKDRIRIRQSIEVHWNTATAEELATLPGIGPELAGRIVAYREEQGGFGSIEEIMEVSGIGEGKFAALKGRITVEDTE